MSTDATDGSSKRIDSDSAARSYEGRFSDPSHTSTPLSMAVDSKRDNDMVMVDTGSR